MKFDGFYGNKRIKEYLSNAFERGEISHAFILSGPEGIGKTTLSRIFARALVCRAEGEKPCGVCPACVKSERDSHPDILHVRPDDKGSIKVEVIRNLKQDAYLRPNDGLKKVYIIHDADTMTQEAQDALLKILEEPPAFTVFLLLCYNERNLLETVRSRCVRLELSPLESEEIEELLKLKKENLSPEEISSLVLRSRGIAGRVLSDDAQGSANENAERIISAIAQGDELKIVESLIAIEKIKRHELKEVIDALISYLRDALVTRHGVDAFYPECDTRALYQKIGSDGIVTILDALSCAKAYCGQNVGVAHITGFLACRIARAVRK